MQSGCKLDRRAVRAVRGGGRGRGRGKACGMWLLTRGCRWAAPPPNIQSISDPRIKHTPLRTKLSTLQTQRIECLLTSEGVNMQTSDLPAALAHKQAAVVHAHTTELQWVVLMLVACSPVGVLLSVSQ